MATPILVMGEIGTGKSVSMRNLDPKTTFIIASDMKPLTIPNSKTNYKTILKENGKLDIAATNYYETKDAQIVKALLTQISNTRPDIKVIIVDTITSIITDEIMKRSHEKGFGKYTDVALDAYELITMLRGLREDLTIVVMSHTEDNYDSEGVLKTSFKVPAGKAIGNQFKPEAYFHMILYTDVSMVNNKPEYSFLTENNGKNTCRSPLGLFSEYKIPNDLSYVISEYQKYEQ